MADVSASGLITSSMIAGGGTAVLAFVRWLAILWRDERQAERAAAAAAATVRRDFEIAQAAARAAFEAQLAAAARADNDKMVAALVETARSSAALVGKLAEVSAVLGGKLDNVADKIDDIRERTPVEGFPLVDLQREPSQRTRGPAAPRSGYRPPSRAGTNNPDPDDT